MTTYFQAILKSKIPAIIWTLIILVLCTLPSEEAAKMASANDKVNHAIAFAGFVFLWLFHTSLTKMVVIIGVFYGLLIEVWQYFLPESFHRGFELLDAVADAAGCILGYLIFILFNYFLEKTKK
jgi:VanZ family protein